MYEIVTSIGYTFHRIDVDRPTLDARFVEVLSTIARALDEHSITWALTGSTSFVLQGVPLTPNDIDIQTTETGAYEIERLFSEQVIDPVTLSEAEMIRSHYGRLDFDGVPVEIMGALEKRRDDGSWDGPVDVTAHRTYVPLEGVQIPVLSLEYEAKAYEHLGRDERAELLRAHVASSSE